MFTCDRNAEHQIRVAECDGDDGYSDCFSVWSSAFSGLGNSASLTS